MIGIIYYLDFETNERRVCFKSDTMNIFFSADPEKNPYINVELSNHEIRELIKVLESGIVENEP